MQLAHTTFPSPLGALRAVATPDGLCALEFSDPERDAALRERLARWYDAATTVEAARVGGVLGATRRWLERYFAGRAPALDVPLDLRGSDFELGVWRALCDIPHGATESYGALSARIGRAGGARAIGGAVGRNPAGIIVPCHRVLAATTLGGYGGGRDRKEWLLRHEGALLA